MEPVLNDKSGFTLVEFLVAILILTVGILGLLQTVNLAISHNMVNQLRYDGTIVADGELARELAKGGTSAGFEAITTPSTSNYNVRRAVLNGFRNYSITRTNAEITANTKQVTVEARWRYKGISYRNEASSLISRLP
jgi:type IV pilus assembly protein PilV